MVKIKVKLHTILNKYAKGGAKEGDSITLSKGTTLKGLADYLAIPEHMGLIFLVNNLPQDKNYILSEGDEVKAFSLICGG